jgi:hypothetical protein
MMRKVHILFTLALMEHAFAAKVSLRKLLFAGSHNNVPDIDCIGQWSSCDSSCNKQFHHQTFKDGNGADCDYDDGASEACVGGEGDCARSIDCEGEWSSCDASCAAKIFTVLVAKSGDGAECDYMDGASEVCVTGEGQCEECKDNWKWLVNSPDTALPFSERDGTGADTCLTWLGMDCSESEFSVELLRECPFACGQCKEGDDEWAAFEDSCGKLEGFDICKPDLTMSCDDWESCYVEMQELCNDDRYCLAEKKGHLLLTHTVKFEDDPVFQGAADIKNTLDDCLGPAFDAVYLSTECDFLDEPTCEDSRKCGYDSTNCNCEDTCWMEACDNLVEAGLYTDIMCLAAMFDRQGRCGMI